MLRPISSRSASSSGSCLARKAAAAAAQHGVLAGLRFLVSDKLLGPLAATITVFGFLAAGMSAGLPVYAYDEFDGSSWIAGLFYAALGAGAVVGSVLAVFVVRKVPPLRLAAFGILAFSIPLWVLPFLPPWPVVFGALFLATLFTPLVNGPTLGVLTSRTPVDLRPKVMTAAISANTLAAPLGFIVAGQVLERWGVVPLFAAVVLGITWMAILFAAITWRHSDGEPDSRARRDVERPPARDGVRAGGRSTSPSCQVCSDQPGLLSSSRTRSRAVVVRSPGSRTSEVPTTVPVAFRPSSNLPRTKYVVACCRVSASSRPFPYSRP